MRLDAKAVGLAVQLQAAGGINHDTWQGQLTGFNIDGNESLHLAARSAGRLCSPPQITCMPTSFAFTDNPDACAWMRDWTPAHWTGGPRGAGPADEHADRRTDPGH